MGVEGIGASVVRKEDRRFITGKGRYVDDIKLLGMTHAHFVRSPHAHAKIKSIDTSAAMKMPGVVGVLTGQQIVDDKIGNLICGWAITSKDGTGDEDGRMAGDGAGNRALRRPGGRGRDRRDQEPGQGRGRSRGRQLRGIAGRGRHSRGDQAGRAAIAPGSAGQRDLRLDHRRRSRNGCGLQVGGQCRLARHHQQPPGAERDGAARGDRRI